MCQVRRALRVLRALQARRVRAVRRARLVPLVRQARRDQGAQGPKGDPSDFVVHAPILVKQVIRAGETKNWRAMCPSGQVVVSGGFGGGSNLGEGLVYSMSEPTYPNDGWWVQATYTPKPGAHDQVDAYAFASCTPGRSLG